MKEENDNSFLEETFMITQYNLVNIGSNLQIRFSSSCLLVIFV